MSEAPQGAAIPQWTLGDRMRKAREHADLSQAQLAAEIGIGRTSVVNYETGRKRPSRPVLLSWALRCGVDHAWLRGDRNPRFGVSAGQDDADDGIRFVQT